MLEELTTWMNNNPLRMKRIQGYTPAVKSVNWDIEYAGINHLTEPQVEVVNVLVFISMDKTREDLEGAVRMAAKGVYEYLLSHTPSWLFGNVTVDRDNIVKDFVTLIFPVRFPCLT